MSLKEQVLSFCFISLIPVYTEELPGVLAQYIQYMHTVYTHTSLTAVFHVNATCKCLPCFDAVCMAAGGAFGL